MFCIQYLIGIRLPRSAFIRSMVGKCKKNPDLQKRSLRSRRNSDLDATGSNSQVITIVKQEENEPGITLGKRRKKAPTVDTKFVKVEEKINVKEEVCDDTEIASSESISTIPEKKIKLEEAESVCKTTKEESPHDIEDIPLTLKSKLARNLASVSNKSWEPVNWKLTLNNIKEMRKNRDAPVDSMGCHKCMDDDALPAVYRYQALISLMLSSQTRDETTFATMQKLKSYESGLTVDSILSMSDDTLGSLIKSVGFWKKKVKFIKETTKILKEKYNGDIPNNVELLCKLPGVGPKMANICMNVAWGIVSGIGVDLHVHRIANRIGWVKKPTKTPEKTQQELESWLPKELWDEVNELLVGFGQQTCKATPLCSTCSNLPYCKFGKKFVKPSKKKKK